MINHHFPVINNYFPMISHGFPVTNNYFPMINHDFPAINNYVPMINHDFPVINNYFPLINHDFSVINNSFPMINHHFPVITIPKPTFGPKPSGCLFQLHLTTTLTFFQQLSRLGCEPISCCDVFMVKLHHLTHDTVTSSSLAACSSASLACHGWVCLKIGFPLCMNICIYIYTCMCVYYIYTYPMFKKYKIP